MAGVGVVRGCLWGSNSQPCSHPGAMRGHRERAQDEETAINHREAFSFLESHFYKCGFFPGDGRQGNEGGSRGMFVVKVGVRIYCSDSAHLGRSWKKIMLLLLYVYKLVSPGCRAPVGCLPSLCQAPRLTLILQNPTTFFVI